MKGIKRGRGRPSQRTSRQLYNDYVKLYNKKASKLLAEGDTPQMPIIEKDLIRGKKSILTFNETFASMKETLKQKGQRPTNARVLDMLVNRQIYAVERPSALKRKKFIEETLKKEGKEMKVSLKDIMRGKKDVDYRAIKEMYHEMKLGTDLSGREVGEIISSTVFGSV